MCVFNFKSVSCVYLISNYICVLNKKKKRNKENFVKKKKKKISEKTQDSAKDSFTHSFI